MTETIHAQGWQLLRAGDVQRPEHITQSLTTLSAADQKSIEVIVVETQQPFRLMQIRVDLQTPMSEISATVQQAFRSAHLPILKWRQSEEWWEPVTENMVSGLKQASGQPVALWATRTETAPSIRVYNDCLDMERSDVWSNEQCDDAAMRFDPD
jgi:hypothetical protein